MRAVIIACLAGILGCTAGVSGPKADTARDPLDAIQQDSGIRFSAQISNGSCGYFNSIQLARIGTIGFNGQTQTAAGFGTDTQSGQVHVAAVRAFNLLEGLSLPIDEDGVLSPQELCGSQGSDQQWNGRSDFGDAAEAFSGRLYHAAAGVLTGAEIRSPKHDGDKPKLPGNSAGGPFAVLGSALQPNKTTDSSAQSILNQAAALAIAHLELANAYARTSRVDPTWLNHTMNVVDAMAPGWACSNSGSMSTAICNAVPQQGVPVASCVNNFDDALANICANRTTTTSTERVDFPAIGLSNLARLVPKNASEAFKRDIDTLSRVALPEQPLDHWQLDAAVRELPLSSRIRCIHEGCLFDVGNGQILRLNTFAVDTGLFNAYTERFSTSPDQRRTSRAVTQLAERRAAAQILDTFGYRSPRFRSQVYQIILGAPSGIAGAAFSDKAEGQSALEFCQDAAVPSGLAEGLLMQHLESARDQLSDFSFTPNITSSEIIVDRDLELLRQQLEHVARNRHWTLDHAGWEQLESLGVVNVSRFITVARNHFPVQDVHAFRGALQGSFSGTDTNLEQALLYFTAHVRADAPTNDAELESLVASSALLVDPVSVKDYF